MRVLIYDPEQYVDFENDTANLEVRLPLLNSGAVSEHADFVYQRVFVMHGPTVLHSMAVKEALAFKPDFLLYSTSWFHQSPSIETMREIQESGIPILSVLYDSMHAPPDYEIELFKLSAGTCVINSFSNYCRYRYWAERAMPEKVILFAGGHTAFTNFFQPIALDKTMDVLVMGSLYGRRVEFTMRMKAALAARGISLNILGGNFHDLPDTQNENAIASKGPVSKLWVGWPDYLKAINSTRICLCPSALDDRDVINGKLFQYMACGAFTLAERNDEIALLTEGSGFDLYRSEDECFATIVDMIAHPDKRAAKAKSVHDWYRRSFDYRRFWNDNVSALMQRRQIPAPLPHLEAEYQRRARAWTAEGPAPANDGDWLRTLFPATRGSSN
jgi:hypothetical protein